MMAVMKEAVKFTEVCYCSILSRMALATSLLFFLISAGFCFHTDVDYINISLIVIFKAKTQYHARQLQELKSPCISHIIYKRGQQFPDSDLVEFLSGSTDSAINFSGSADLHTPIHPPCKAKLSVP